MSASTRAAVASSSPQSAGEVTHQDTPSTNYTIFSPEAGGSTGKRDKNKGKAPLALAPIVRGSTVTSIHGDDVFLAPTPMDGGQRTSFSPTADEFTPGFPATPNSATPRPGAGNIMAYRPAAIGPRHFGANALIGDSVPDHVASITIPQDCRGVIPGVIGQPSSVVTGVDDVTCSLQHFGLSGFQTIVVQEGRFSADEYATRAFAITNCTSLYAPPAIEQVLRSCKLPTAGIDVTRLQSDSRIVITFHDVRDAKQAYALLDVHRPPASALQLYTPRDLAVHRGEGNGQRVSLFEGQVLVQVFYNQNERLSADHALSTIKTMLSQFGEVKAFHSIPSNQGNLREFRVEFHDLRAAARLIDSTATQAQQLLNGFLVDVIPFTPDVSVPGSSNLRTPPSAPRQELVSVTGRSMVPAGTPGYEQLVDSIQREQGFGRRRGAHGQYTRIEISRIKAGADVRTTVMLRNIPNRVTQAQLKEIFDNTSLGDYDFMYLRIDFANNCNVGYAFINFVDPFAIIPFAEAHQGMRWNEFNSAKVAEISYATIQGLENLAQKFRNSSVMMEHPSFRPKLFFTRDEPQAGQEKPFLKPDNITKMRRSIENAETVGLYPQARYSPNPYRNNSSTSTIPARRPAGPSLLPLPPAPRLLTAPRSGIAALTSPGVQALINPPTSALPTPPSTAGITYSQPLLSGGGSVTPYTPSTPPEPRAPFRSSGTFNPHNVVDTSSPSDPFSGRPNRLFAPRQGQAFREEQRRRRSQFDRGTPGAELELRSSGAMAGPSDYDYGPQLGTYQFTGYHTA